MSAAVRRDPVFKTDVLTSAVLDFGGRQATFTCATQLEPDQRVHLLGTTGRLEVEIPFNIPPDLPTRVVLAAGGDPGGARPDGVRAAPMRSVHGAGRRLRRRRGEHPGAHAAEDALGNLRVIEQILATDVGRSSPGRRPPAATTRGDSGATARPPVAGSGWKNRRAVAARWRRPRISSTTSWSRCSLR